MNFDTLTLAAITDELRATLLGGRIQRIRLPSSLSLALEIYAHGQRHHLLLSAHPQFARAHLTTNRPTRGVEKDTRLLLLMRKYVLGARIQAIEQPELERILIVSIAKGAALRNTPQSNEGDDQPMDLGEEPPEGEIWRADLIVEVMERRSNIMLVDDNNIILDCVRRVTSQQSRRPIGPHEPYELPPKQEKRDPRHATADGIVTALSQNPSDPARALLNAYRGVSPQAAREVLFRATGSPAPQVVNPEAAAAIAHELCQIWVAPWQPSLVLRNDEPLAFAPYRVTHLPGAEPQPSISAALDRFFVSREHLSAHSQRREALAEQLGEARERIERTVQQLQKELAQVQQLEQLRWEGEMILGFQHSLRTGATQLVVEDQTITLDPAKSPLENAQARFKAYDKAKGALAQVPERLAAAETRRAGIDELLTLLALAEGYDQIEELAREAAEQGHIRRAATPTRSKRLPPLRVVSSDGWTIYVGRSSNQNEQVTFGLGSSDDLWLHVRNLPGAHVIIKTGGREVPESTLLEAAQLAAYYSRGRDSTSVEVDIAPRRMVRRVPDGSPGLVHYQAQQTVRVSPKKREDI
jgi:predicted ribosome quality control (RQC) complex YloA/Tae2 family protein